MAIDHNGINDLNSVTCVYYNYYPYFLLLCITSGIC